jgi:lipid-A-disaccharide synthase
MKYFLIAGEQSGDQHGAKLMSSLMELDTQAEFDFFGGDSMERVSGKKAVIHIRNLAFMGFTQVLTKLRKIRQNFQIAKRSIHTHKPDALILIDYAGFNLRMAAWAHQKNIPVYYYIAPKVWAWNSGRIKKIRKYTNHVLAILPFEEEYFNSRQVNCTFVGNPVREDILSLDSRDYQERIALKTIALLPGSRKQEIQRILPEMLDAARLLPEYSFVLAGMSMHKDLYARLIPQDQKIEIQYDQPRELLGRSMAALVTSGTATLETALLGTPQLVCYKTSELSYQLARRLIKVPYISLVNLIMEGPAVPEYIQRNCQAEALANDLKMILPGGSNHDDQRNVCTQIEERLGNALASKNAASQIISLLGRVKQHQNFS